MKPLAASIQGLKYTSPSTTGKQFRKLKLKREHIVPALKEAKKISSRKADVLVRGILKTVKNKKQFATEGKELFSWARKGGRTERKMVMRAMHDDGGEAASLYMVHQISGMKKKDARAFMKDYVAVGGEVSAIATWLQLAGKVLKKQKSAKTKTAGAVVDAVEGAADWLVDTLEEGVDTILESIEAVVDAIIEAGVSLATVFGEMVEWTVEQIGEALRAILEAGIALGEVIGQMVRMTYNACAQFVAALLEIGRTVAEILTEVATATYWQLRRIVNGLIRALGPVGEILEWVWEQVSDVTDRMWRWVLNAIRYAEGVLTNALEWAYARGAEAMEAILRAWESIREDLITAYEWAKGAAEDVWDYIGQATARIGNSIYYVLEYLKEDFVAGIFHFIKGLLKAAFAVADIIAWMVEQAVEIVVDVVRALLEMGSTIGTLVANVVTRPRDAMSLLMQALDDIGTTLQDLYESVIEETGEEFLEQVTLALREIGQAVKDMLTAVAEVATGAFWTVVNILLNTLNTYRPMTAQEIADARQVFGDQLEYDKIYFAEESAVNDIIFGIQDFASGNSNSRAFTTNTLVNFDPDDNNWDRATMIHELTHVWQSLETGSFYMTEAIIAQATTGYNYGYDEGVNTITVPTDYDGNSDDFDEGDIAGLGAESELNAAGGNLESFNVEQQAQIIMHYYVRRHLLNQAQTDWAPWLPYAQFVNADLT